jgi:alginate O-acetyltransferase complex protein AlgI
MLFNSLHFLLFFVLVTTAYFSIPHRFRWQLLLVSSCYFYMVFLPIYILILGFTIVVDYFAGIWIEKTKEKKKRKQILILSLIANILMLAIFKYYNFLNGNLSDFMNSIGYVNHIPDLSILLPIGLSFHTFQAMSYTIEVYRGNQKAERQFGIYALYVMYYPQLVAGPIERPQNVLHQYHAKHNFDYQRVTSGLKLMTWGFFKKVVVADRIAPLVDYVYNDPYSFEGVSLIVATVLFAFQIYADFSGYSDIAIGASRVMGINLMLNFRQPYFAASIGEFWKRWHISLSTWFRDYLYIPLGGNRVGKLKHMTNLFITFLISGIWHGANWTFVIWGALHGAFLVIESIVDRYVKFPASVPIRLFRIGLTFILVCFAWIFFRAATISDALYIVSGMFSNSGESLRVFSETLLGAELYTWLIIAVALLIVFIVECYQQKGSVSSWINTRPKPIRWLIYITAVMLILGLGQFDTLKQFIYFQF